MAGQIVAARVVILNLCKGTLLVFMDTRNHTRLDVISLKCGNYLFCEYACTLYIVTLKEPLPHSPSICSCQSVS